MTSKSQEIYSFVKRHAEDAIALASVDMNDRTQAETIRVNRRWLATCVADQIAKEYHLLELLDIVEWKRQKVRR